MLTSTGYGSAKKLGSVVSSVRRWLRKRGLLILQSAVLLFFVVILLSGGQKAASIDSETLVTAPSFYSYDRTAVDEVAAAEVAAAIAQAGRMVIADSITNLADSLSVQVDLRDPEVEYYLEKPSLISTKTKTNADIITYTVAEGDTISSIAQKFNITSDTVRWSNDLVGEAVAVGKQLTILPISGLLYSIHSGDTAELLAQRYSTDAQAIISFNDLELTGLVAGQQIIIPDGKIPAPAPSRYNYPANYSLNYGGNGYFYGYCTWHVANRRAQIGNPLPRNLGHAVTWYPRAVAGGLPTGAVPQTGAVLWHKNSSIGIGYGHVAFVEEVLADGSARVSDMNWEGWNVVSERIVPPEEFDKYMFIY